MTTNVLGQHVTGRNGLCSRLLTLDSKVQSTAAATVHTNWSGSNLKTQAAKQLLRWHQVCSAQVLHCLRRWLPYPASPWSHLDMYL